MEIFDKTSFIHFLMFIFCSVGMAHVLVDGTGPVEWIRNQFKALCNQLMIPGFGKMIECYLCCGCWCGWLMAWVWFSFPILAILGLGFGAGFLSNATAIFLNFLEAKSLLNLNDDGDK